MTMFLRGVLVIGSALMLSVAQAEPRQIAWDNLTLKMQAGENPFAGLPAEHLEALVDVAAMRSRKARGITASPQEEAIEKAAVTKLQKAGINVDRLLAQRDEIAARQRAVAGAVNPAMDGQEVRLPGYLLPLEFTGKEVSEFLLVPWVGACIHTPPPPANQIVHVKSERPFAVKGMFDAVIVTGRIATRAAKKSVYITDGSTDVDVGYSMQAIQVEPYKP